MIKYIRGCIINILNFRISLFSLIDHESMVDKKAKIYRKTKIFRSKIDSYTYVAPNTIIICTDIGKFCSIAEHCSIGLTKHSLRNISNLSKELPEDARAGGRYKSYAICRFKERVYADVCQR